MENLSILNLPPSTFTRRICRISRAIVARRYPTSASSYFSSSSSKMSIHFGVIGPECCLQVSRSFKSLADCFFFSCSFFTTDNLFAFFTVSIKSLSNFFTFLTSSEHLAHFHCSFLSDSLFSERGVN